MASPKAGKTPAPPKKTQQNATKPAAPAKKRAGAVASKGAKPVAVKKAAITGVGRARVNQAGCLDRCEQGPVMVVYPEGVWYRYANEADVDEIVAEHLLKGQPVSRLRI